MAKKKIKNIGKPLQGSHNTNSKSLRDSYNTNKLKTNDLAKKKPVDRSNTMHRIFIVLLVVVLIVFIGLILLEPIFNTAPEKIVANSSKEKKTGLFVTDTIFRYYTNGTGYIYVVNESFKIGIAADREFNFGKIAVNMTTKKSIGLSSSQSVKISFVAYGNISKYISFSENNFILNGTKSIEISFSPRDEGFFEGEIDIHMRRAKSPIFNWLV